MAFQCAKGTKNSNHDQTNTILHTFYTKLKHFILLTIFKILDDIALYSRKQSEE